jgi:hypothetical protein
LAHVAGAFEKPCVTIAGGREPDTFERYPNHRYLDNVGALPCCAKRACWHNALGACKDHDGEHAHCMRLILVGQVREALLSYYAGGALQAIRNDAPARRRRLIRIVASAKCLGGAERSVCEIASMFCQKDWRVEFASPTGHIAADVARALPDAVKPQRRSCPGATRGF